MGIQHLLQNIYFRLLGLALGLTILSLIRTDRMSGESFFSLFDGPAFYGHGFPFWFLLIYFKGGWRFNLLTFIFDLLFWLVVVLILYLVGRAFINFTRKI
jgi:hypothetical protein